MTDQDRFAPGVYRHHDGDERLQVTTDTLQPFIAVTFIEGVRKGLRTGLHRLVLKRDWEKEEES
jgi:hypothetical protein